MSGSLHRRLIAVLGATVLVAWLATAFFSYLDAREQLSGILDDQLAQSAELMAALLRRIPPGEWGEAAVVSAGGDVVAFQVWTVDGRQILRSAKAPPEPLAAGHPGTADLARDGERWRTHTRVDDEAGLIVMVGRPARIGDELAGSVVTHLMHPLWIAVPLLAMLIWLAVRWGLAPLQRLAADLRLRAPADLRPLGADNVPAEVQPLVDALEGLLVRIGALIERERRFAGDAAHELRTPLAAIQTHAEVAMAARDDTERQRAIENVLRGTDRAGHLVEQLLVLARLDGQAPAPQRRIPLAEHAAAAVAESAGKAAKKNIDLGMTEDSDADAAVMASPELVAVLLRNLIDNALRYVPAGSRVDVSVRRAGGRVVLRVADDGPGIPPAERARVVDRFYRVLGTGKEGSGLGLSIVAAIAESQGAALELGAGLGGRGLGVTVSFPADPGA